MSRKPTQFPDQDALVARWEARQEQLASLLEACGATNGDRHIDWIRGTVVWRDRAGQTLATAEMKALCSYSFEDEALMMAWAQGEDVGAVIAPMPDIPEEVEDIPESDAWLWAMSLAQASRAEFLYRVSSPPYLVFLGLWNLTSTLSEAHIETGSADAFVLAVLDKVQQELAQEIPNPSEVRKLLLNQGESLLQNVAVLSPDQRTMHLIERTGQALIDLGSSVGQRKFGLLPPDPFHPDDVFLLTRKVESLRAAWLKR